MNTIGIKFFADWNYMLVLIPTITFEYGVFVYHHSFVKIEFIWLKFEVGSTLFYNF